MKIICCSSTAVATREITQSIDGATPAEGDGTAVDFSLTSATLTFTPGQRKKDILVDINDDDIGENREAFVVELVEVSPDSNNFIGYPRRQTVYIIDDDGGSDGGDGGDGTDDGQEGKG